MLVEIKKKKKKGSVYYKVYSVVFSSSPVPGLLSESKLWVWSKTDLLILKVKLGVGSFPITQRTKA